MELRRISTSGASGATSRNADTSKRVGAVQARAAGAVQLPRVSVYSASAQSIATSTNTGINLAYSEYDTNALQDASTSSWFEFTDETAGVWAFYMTVAWANNTTGYRQVEAKLNPSGANSSIPQSQSRLLATAATSNGSVILQSQWVQTMQAGDTLQPVCWQNSGGALNLNDAAFQAYRIGV